MVEHGGLGESLVPPYKRGSVSLSEWWNDLLRWPCSEGGCAQRRCSKDNTGDAGSCSLDACEARCTDHTDFVCTHWAHDAADNECYLFAACLGEGDDADYNLYYQSKFVTAAAPAPAALGDSAKSEVRVALKITGYTVDTFMDAEKTAFKAGIAKVADVNTADVTINSVTTSVDIASSRRHLLATGIVVDFTIRVLDAASASATTQTISTTSAATMVATLKMSGLTNVESITVTLDPKAPPATDEAKSGARQHSFFAALVVMLFMMMLN